jgi:hypothetical protein
MSTPSANRPSETRNTRDCPQGWGPLTTPSPYVLLPYTHPQESLAATFASKLAIEGQKRRARAAEDEVTEGGRVGPVRDSLPLAKSLV